MSTEKKIRIALICGMLGCLCYGGGDWLMIYGNPAYQGTVSWLIHLDERKRIYRRSSCRL